MSNIKTYARSTATKYARALTKAHGVEFTIVERDDRFIIRCVVATANLPADLQADVLLRGVNLVIDAPVAEPKVVIPNVVNSVAALRGVALPCQAPKQVKLFGKGIKIQKDRITQNGITQPSKGGKCRAVWDECDRLLKANNGIVPMPKELKAWARENGYNENNAVIELYVWRKFMGFGKKAA